MSQTEKTFFDGLFHRGELPPCIYSNESFFMYETLYQLLARLTNGEDVGVAAMEVALTLDEQDCDALNAFGGTWQPRRGIANCFDGTTVFIPGVGFWVCVPMFDDARSAMRDAQELRWAYEETLRYHHANGDCPDVDPHAVSFDIALIAISERHWDLRGIDPRHAYLPHTFSALSKSLRERARSCDPAALNAAVRFLAKQNYLRDRKSLECFAGPWDLELPTWVEEYAPRVE